MRISDWSSDVCSSDLELVRCLLGARQFEGEAQDDSPGPDAGKQQSQHDHLHHDISLHEQGQRRNGRSLSHQGYGRKRCTHKRISSPFWRRVKMSIQRSEEHTSELQSLMRISYAVFCL